MADQTTPTSEPVTVAPPPPPEPYPAEGYPKVLFSKIGSHPPRIVNNDAELAALDPLQWTQIPPAAPKEGEEKPKYPRLYINVNVLPKVVATEQEAAALGPEWKDFDIAPIAEAQQKSETP